MITDFLLKSSPGSVFFSQAPKAASKATVKEQSTTSSSAFKQESSQVELSPEGKKAAQLNLSEQELKEVEKLKERDAEVKQHEQAHLTAAGQYAKGGAQYKYQTGPDSKKYAIGGHVNIDTSPIKGDPEATIQKAQQIKQAASAPSEPSSKDQQVASEAAQMEQKARKELQQLKSSFGQSQQYTGNSLNLVA